MEKILLFIISGPLFLGLWFNDYNDSLEKNNYSYTDSIPVKKDTTLGKSCLDCHGVLVEKKLKHPAKNENACQDCHKSGSKDHPKTAIGLIKNLPDLCLSCHDEKKELIASSPSVHKAVTEKKFCVNCHSPHSSDNKKLLVAPRKVLCLSCHNKAVKEDGTPAINFEKLMKSKTLHPPFEDCEKTCHNPHAGTDRRMLNTTFLSNSYVAVVSDSFALCWECHGADMIEKPKTKGATNFRNGEDNLHWVHVNGAKGRSCMMCHSPHATDNLHLIRDNVRFGSWSFRMNYKANENGGSCLPSCHAERSYTR